jgi:hypothetical protein
MVQNIYGYVEKNCMDNILEHENTSNDSTIDSSLFLRQPRKGSEVQCSTFSNGNQSKHIENTKMRNAHENPNPNL